MQKMYRLCAFILAMSFSAGMSVCAEETPISDDGIKALIKDLGSDDFEKRQSAEKKLGGLGVRAEPILKAAMEAATDPQIRATTARLMGRLKLANIGNVDYLGVFPAESVMFLQLRNLTESIDKSKTTAMGKLYLSPAMEPFRKKIDAAMKEKPEQKALFDLWTKRFSGQFGFSLWQFSIMPDQMRLAFIGQITDPNPSAVFNDLLKLTGAGEGLKKSENYRDVDILENPMGVGALALVGSHIIGGINRDSVKTAIDNLLKPAGVAASPDYLKLKGSLGEKPEFLFGMDYRAYMKQLMSMMELMGQAEQAKGMEKAMADMGVDLHRFMMATSANGLHYEDRMIMTMGGDPKGLMAISVVPPDATPPLEDMAIIPANAVAAGVQYVNGAAAKQGIGDYLKALSDLMSLEKKEQPPEAAKENELKKFLADFEQKAGLKFEDAFSGFKGSAGYYVVLAPGGILEAPDIGMFFTFADNAAAMKFSDAMKKGLNSVGPQAAVREVGAPNRKLQQIDLVALGAKLPEKFPYNPVWVVEGNRVFMASSVQALRKQLTYIDNKTPGLLTQPDFVKAMGLLKPEERRGQVVYVDMKTLMTLGATVALPFMQAGAPDEGIKQALAALPPPQELFKDFPPLLATGIQKGTTQESVIRGPIPPIPSLILFGIGAATLAPRMAPRGVAPENPGGF